MLLLFILARTSCYPSFSKVIMPDRRYFSDCKGARHYGLIYIFLKPNDYKCLFMFIGLSYNFSSAVLVWVICLFFKLDLQFGFWFVDICWITRYESFLRYMYCKYLLLVCDLFLLLFCFVFTFFMMLFDKQKFLAWKNIFFSFFFHGAFWVLFKTFLST